MTKPKGEIPMTKIEPLDGLREKISDIILEGENNDASPWMIAYDIMEAIEANKYSQRLSIAATILAGMMVNHCGEDADGGAVVALQYADALIKAGARHE